MSGRGSSWLPGRRLRRARAALAALFALALVLFSPVAVRAESLSPEELSVLSGGGIVRRNSAFEYNDGRYVGGVAYVVIRAPMKDVMEALTDVGAYTKILPMTAEATVVGRKGDDKLVALKHWTRFAKAGYTVRLRRESPGLVRFWMDASFPHDLEDCWGYFRVQPLTKTTSLFTYGAALNLGFGFARMFFEGKIQGYAMQTPELVRRYVEERAAARKPAPPAH